MLKKRIIILGAGLSGLSAAWHIQRGGQECQIFEKESESGGLCRSKKIGGFIFDYCGHLLHFKYPYVFKLIKNLTNGSLIRHKKSAWIYSHQRFTSYPFQANLYGLPPDIVRECLLGFIQAGSKVRPKKNSLSFLDWINETFGKGIARHFMVPYNTKFWTVSPVELTCEWLDGFIPLPSLKELIQGTIEKNTRPFGYNAIFWYPKDEGIREIPRLLSTRINCLHTLYEAEKIDIKNKKIYFRNGAKERYDKLIFTLPLPEILRLAKNIPAHIAGSLKKLRYTSIFNLNLGINKKAPCGKHWVYFPEKEFVFYRIGFPHNFSPKSSPQGKSSLYAEVAYSHKMPINKNTIVKKITCDLVRAGILSHPDEILVKDINDIKYGYIIYDRARSDALKNIRHFLNKNNILTAGRYGSWSYMSMEDALLDGKRAGEAIAC